MLAVDQLASTSPSTQHDRRAHVQSIHPINVSDMKDANTRKSSPGYTDAHTFSPHERHDRLKHVQVSLRINM